MDTNKGAAVVRPVRGVFDARVLFTKNICGDVKTAAEKVALGPSQGCFDISPIS